MNPIHCLSLTITGPQTHTKQQIHAKQCALWEQEYHKTMILCENMICMHFFDLFDFILKLEILILKIECY